MELTTPKKMGTSQVTSVAKVCTQSQAPNNQLDTYTNIGTNPYIVIGQLNQTLAKEGWELSMDNMRKNNPAEFSKMQKNSFKYIGQPVQIPIPASYLIDKNPNDIVMYEGYGSPDLPGLKISEKEGDKVVASRVLSPEKNDPRFQDIKCQYVITEEFCKQTNKEMANAEKRLVKEENKKYGRKIGDEPTFRFTGRRNASEKTGITSGWNGGKTLIDLEDRSPSMRSL